MDRPEKVRYLLVDSRDKTKSTDTHFDYEIDLTGESTHTAYTYNDDGSIASTETVDGSHGIEPYERVIKVEVKAVVIPSVTDEQYLTLNINELKPHLDTTNANSNASTCALVLNRTVEDKYEKIVPEEDAATFTYSQPINFYKLRIQLKRREGTITASNKPSFSSNVTGTSTDLTNAVYRNTILLKITTQ